MRRSAFVPAAFITALVVSGCGGGNEGGNIGRTAQRELRVALARGVERSRQATATLMLKRCVAPDVGVSLPDATVSDVAEAGQGNDTLEFDCSVTETSASAGEARWVYNLRLQATGRWQASLRAGGPSSGNAASCDAGVCPGVRGAMPPLALSGGRAVNSATRPATQTVGSAAPAPHWNEGLTAMSSKRGAEALRQAHVKNAEGCLAVATASGYPRYAMARPRSIAVCETPPRGTAREYVLQRHDGVWENIWEGNAGCPPALPAPVIRAMFHLRASVCEDS